MKVRDSVVEYQKALDDSNTLTVDLKIVDPVSALYLEFQGTNGASGNIYNTLSEVITGIEIVDGGETLVSLNNFQLEALHFYKTKQTPTLFASEWLSGTQRHGALLLFGRYLWDTEFGFNPRDYDNPQLKITPNIAAVRAAGASGYVSGSLRATVVAKIMEDITPPGKYLAAKEVKSFTSATSGDEAVRLPTDKAIRMLLLRAYVAGNDIDENISDLKIRADSDKWVMLNRKVKQLDAEALAMFGVAEYKHDFHQAYSGSWRVLVNKEPFALLYCQDPSVPRVWVVYAQWSSQIYTEQYDMTGALDSTARDVTAWIRGHAIHSTVPVPFGDPNKPETWLDPTSFGRLEALLTQAAAAQVEVVVEQVERK